MYRNMKRKDFASDEEHQVYYWLKEAEAHGMVSNVAYQPGPFELSPRASARVFKQLKTKTKQIDQFLFHPHRYTPDFAFNLLDSSLNGVFKFPQNSEVVIDVKGGFNPYGDPKQFSINQKRMWQRFEIYAEKIVPEKLFKKTWVPEGCRLTPKQKKPVKKYIGVPTVTEFLERKEA
jgi:hypothetical protein